VSGGRTTTPLSSLSAAELDQYVPELVSGKSANLLLICPKAASSSRVGKRQSENPQSAVLLMLFL
jgi:hypothetical protein